MIESHRMDMAIPESRQYVHSFGRDHFCIGRHPEFAHGPHGGDALVLDNYHTVGQWMTAEAVDETTAHQHKRTCLSRCEDKEEEKYRTEIGIHKFKRMLRRARQAGEHSR